MAVFAGVVDSIAALQHFRGILRIYGLKRLCRGVMQAMRERDPGLAVLID